MDDLRKQITFREPFIAPRTKVKNRFRGVLLYGLAGFCGLSAVAAAMHLFMFAK